MERHQRQAVFDPSVAALEDAARLREIGSAFDEVAVLAKADMPRAKFAERFLHSAVRAVSAAGGAIWELTDRNEPRAIQSVNLDHLQLAAGEDAEAKHARLIGSVFESMRGALVSPHSMIDSVGTAANPTDYFLLLQPVMLTERAIAVLELVLAPDGDPRNQRTSIEVADSLAELASEFYLRDALRRDKSNAQILNEFELFVRRIHETPRLEETAQAIVNQGRRFLECDRVSLVQRDPGRCTLRAVSGVEAVNRRSNAVRTLEDLVAGVLANGESYQCFDESSETSRDVKPLLDAYLDECPVRQVAILPLVAPLGSPDASDQQPLGALVVESFQDPLPSWLRPRVELIRIHCALALRNTLLARTHGLRHWLKPKRLSKSATVLGIMALIVAILALVPADFSIEAKGRLQPLERREVFAPSAGIVRAIHVAHSQHVARNDVLVILENPTLELEYERVRGELQTVRERLSALEATRGTQTARDAKDLAPGMVVAQVEELKERLKNLETQKALMEKQRESLVLKSPLDGEVITWKPDDILRDRPVERGQRLVTVAAPNGPWVLELLIPDQLIGHILNAQNKLGDDLTVTYILATDPSRTYTSKIRSVATSVEMYEDHQPYVLATVDLTGDDIPAKRPGATVVARVHCGRRPLGYVWLRELWETIQRSVVL